MLTGSKCHQQNMKAYCRDDSTREAGLLQTTNLHRYYDNTTILRPFFQDHLVERVPEEIFWTFMMPEKITEADTPTTWVGATPSAQINDPCPPSPIFTPDARLATTLSLYPGLGQAQHTLTASGVVIMVTSY